MSIHVVRPHQGIVVVTIDSPPTVNAITQDMLVRLARAFGDIATDESVCAVILTASGRKAFSTGINLGDAEKVFKMDESDTEKDIVHQMERCTFPIIGDHTSMPKTRVHSLLRDTVSHASIFFTAATT